MAANLINQTLQQQAAENTKANARLVWNPDNVRDVAESVGISTLNEEAVRALSQDVEYRVGQVIVEAMRFMHLGKRTVLGTQDISQALKVLDVEPLYGYESTRPLRFGEASLGPGQPLFYIEDEEVDFEKLINAPLPKVPRDISFTAHWLAVEGVQPTIPQNPTTADLRSTDLLPKGPSTNTLSALAGSDNITVKPLVKHVVSKELILFFDKIRAALLDRDTDPSVTSLRESALESIRSDPGLQQLVPYYVQFIAEKVTHNLHDLFVLKQMIDLTTAIVSNQNLSIDAYVSPLVPPILTCLLGRHIGPPSPSLALVKEKYQLRDLSASLLHQIVQKYAKSSSELQARLARTCLKTFLEPARTLEEHYGAIIGITAVGGAPAIESLVVPSLKTFEYVLNKAQSEGEGSETGLKMLIAALMKAVMTLVPEEESMMNGVTSNGHSDEAKQVEDYLGSVIGGRVAGSGNHALIKKILEIKETQ